MKKLLSAVVFTAGVIASLATATAAQAAPACEEAATFTFSQCAGSYQLRGGQNDVTNGGADNLATQILNDQDVFGETNWDFGAKHDGNVSGSDEAGLSVEGLGSSAGTFSFSNIDLATTDIAVSLKSSRGFSLYYFEAGTVSSLDEFEWNTEGTSVNQKGKAQGLSHLSYYTRTSTIPELEKKIRKVPEPAFISSLFIVGMVMLRRRQSMEV